MSARNALVLACLFAAAPATAGTLYRCVGADGIPNFSSKRVPATTCKVVARTSGNTRFAKSPPTPAAVAVPTPPPTQSPSAAASESNTGRVVQAPPERQAIFRTAADSSALPAVDPSIDVRVTRGTVYRYQVNGVIHYTNRPPKGQQAKVLFSYLETCYACGLQRGLNFSRVALNTQAYRDEIRAASRQFGVEEAIVRAVIHAESAYRPNALSLKGAQGLMQLIPATASRFGVSDPFDPSQNIRGGVQYLAWLMRRYRSDLQLVAAAYNAGEGAVDRNGGVPPYSETRLYVQRVGLLADRYRSALARPNG